jgi:hypothetical protein
MNPVSGDTNIAATLSGERLKRPALAPVPRDMALAGKDIV